MLLPTPPVGLKFKRLRDAPSFSSVLPEHVPIVEQLVCARAAAFVGNVASTFGATVLVERDRRAATRNSTFFWGVAPGNSELDAPAVALPPPEAV